MLVILLTSLCKLFCSICKLYFLGLELGVGEGIIVKAIAQATGRAPDKVKADVLSRGDVGLVAETSKGMQRTLSLFRFFI